MQNYEVRWWDHPWHSSQRRLRALRVLRVVWGQVQHSSRHWTTWSSSSLGRKTNDVGSENWKKNYGKIRWYHRTVQSDQCDFHLHCKSKCHTVSLFCTMFYGSEGMIYSKFWYPDQGHACSNCGNSKVQLWTVVFLFLSQFYGLSLLQTGIVASLATEAPNTSCRSPGRSRWTRCSLQSTSIGQWWNMATRGTMFSLVQLCTKMVQLGINFTAKTGLHVDLIMIWMTWHIVFSNVFVSLEFGSQYTVPSITIITILNIENSCIE